VYSGYSGWSVLILPENPAALGLLVLGAYSSYRVAVWITWVVVPIGGGVERFIEGLSSLIRVVFSGEFSSGGGRSDSDTPAEALGLVEESSLSSTALLFPFPERILPKVSFVCENSSTVRGLRCWINRSLWASSSVGPCPVG
jgi:hypothetical protein